MARFAVGILAGGLIQLALLAFQQRSLGKRWMGLRIVRKDGRPAGAFRVLLVRTPVQLLNYLPVVGPVLWIANLVLALRASPASVHDNAAGTQVVMERETVSG